MVMTIIEVLRSYVALARSAGQVYSAMQSAILIPPLTNQDLIILC